MLASLYTGPRMWAALARDGRASTWSLTFLLPRLHRPDPAPDTRCGARRDFVIVFTSTPDVPVCTRHRTAADDDDRDLATRAGTRTGGVSLLLGAAACAVVAGLGLAALVGALVGRLRRGVGALVGTGCRGRGLRVRRRRRHVVAGLMPAASLLVALLTYMLQVVLMALVFVALTGRGPLGRHPRPRTGSSARSSRARRAGSWARSCSPTRARIPVYDLPRAPAEVG